MLHTFRPAVLALLLPFGAAASPAFAAGDVTAVVENGKLTITGADAGYDIEINSSGSPDSFRITGKNGTTINGAATFDAPAAHSIAVTFGGGADRVEVRGFRIRRNLRVNLGSGNDNVVLSDLVVAGRTGIRCGEGADVVKTDSDTTLSRGFRVRGGEGADQVQVFNSHMLGPVVLITGDEPDRVTLFDSRFGDDATVTVLTGADDDYLELNDCDFQSDVRAHLGSDDDDCVLRASEHDEDVEIDGGSGNDDELDRDGGNDYKRRPQFDDFEETD